MQARGEVAKTGIVSRLRGSKRGCGKMRRHGLKAGISTRQAIEDFLTKQSSMYVS